MSVIHKITNGIGLVSNYLKSPPCTLKLYNGCCLWKRSVCVNTQSVRSVRLYTQSVRSISFISQLTTEKLWDTVTGVSNAGRKRGRGKSRMKRPSNLYKGKIIGQGVSGEKWPGLNAPVSVGQHVMNVNKPMSVTDTVMQSGTPAVVKVTTNTEEAAPRKGRFNKVPALQRGWSGNKFPGMSAGVPDPIGDYVFEGFDSRILEFKMVANMTGNHGRKMRFSALVITGNGQGLAGFAFSKSTNAQSAIRKAKNRAAQKLQYFERFENHTVFHNFYTKENKTAIFAKKQHQGYGLVCHRALKTMCEVIGIHNLYAKVEGSTGNVLALTRAFFMGLGDQENHQKLADRVNLHVVEMRREMDYMPIVVASPTIGHTRQEVGGDEDLNFDRYYYDGKVPLDKKKKEPFYANFASHQKKLDRMYKLRNQPRAKLDRIMYGIESPREKWRKHGDE